MPFETMRDYPALDFVLRGEPELTLRELIDVLEGTRQASRPDWFAACCQRRGSALAAGRRRRERETASTCPGIKGLVWRDGGEYRQNPDRPFIPNLDALPVPMYDLLPLSAYRMPLMKGPFCFVLTSRGCPAGCKYCIKHVSYQWSVRLLSPERVVRGDSHPAHDRGIRNIHMYADLFTVNREQVMGICELILKEGLKIKWTCNSRVDYVDEEMLTLMGTRRLLDDHLGHRERQ